MKYQFAESRAKSAVRDGDACVINGRRSVFVVVRPDDGAKALGHTEKEQSAYVYLCSLDNGEILFTANKASLEQVELNDNGQFVRV